MQGPRAANSRVGCVNGVGASQARSFAIIKMTGVRLKRIGAIGTLLLARTRLHSRRAVDAS